MYLAVKGNEVITVYASTEEFEGLQDSVIEITAGEWDAAGRAARVAEGKIVLGRAEGEKEAERVTAEIALIDRGLSEIDMKQARSSAEIAEAVLLGNPVPEETAALHLERQQRAGQLRARRRELRA